MKNFIFTKNKVAANSLENKASEIYVYGDISLSMFDTVEEAYIIFIGDFFMGSNYEMGYIETLRNIYGFSIYHATNGIPYSGTYYIPDEPDTISRETIDELILKQEIEYIENPMLFDDNTLFLLREGINNPMNPIFKDRESIELLSSAAHCAVIGHTRLQQTTSVLQKKINILQGELQKVTRHRDSLVSIMGNVQNRNMKLSNELLGIKARQEDFYRWGVTVKNPLVHIEVFDPIDHLGVLMCRIQALLEEQGVTSRILVLCSNRNVRHLGSFSDYRIFEYKTTVEDLLATDRIVLVGGLTGDVAEGIFENPVGYDVTLLVDLSDKQLDITGWRTYLAVCASYTLAQTVGEIEHTITVTDDVEFPLRISNLKQYRGGYFPARIITRFTEAVMRSLSGGATNV